MNSRVRIATAALAVALGLTGCVTATPTKDDAPKAGTNADKKSADKKAAAQAKANDKANLSSLHFGDTAKWPSGVTVTVSKPKSFTPSDTSAGGGKNNVRMTLTLVNGTEKPLEPIMISATMQSGDKEATPIFDGEDLSLAPSTKLLAGRQAKWDFAFAVKNPRDLVLEVSPGDFTSDSALFTS